MSQNKIKTVTLQSRRPGGEWGTRNKLNELNARQFLREDDRDFLTQKQVEEAAHALAVTWTDRVKGDDSEFRVMVT